MVEVTLAVAGADAVVAAEVVTISVDAAAVVDNHHPYLEIVAVAVLAVAVVVVDVDRTVPHSRRGPFV